MFEEDEEVVKYLRVENSDFQHLYNKHHELKERVKDAESGLHPIDDNALGILKKQKLLLKDKMAELIEQYRREHS